MQRLPSVNALRAFVAAARNSSFKKAAEELHVTPAAISHQVKALEAEMGVSLFSRLANGLTLTRDGQRLLPGLERGFEQLTAAVNAVRPKVSSNRVEIAVAPSFAARWLLPRLPNFIQQHPQVDVHISAAESLIERRDGNGTSLRSVFGGQPGPRPEIAIAFGRGEYPGCRAEPLFRPQLALFCAPALLSGTHPLKSLADLRYHTLLIDDTPYFSGTTSSWDVWLAHASAGNSVKSKRVLRLSQAVLALDAAADGLGVALSVAPLALADVSAGRLTVPFGPAITCEWGYDLLTSSDTDMSREASLFRDWMLAEAGKDTSALAQVLSRVTPQPSSGATTRRRPPKSSRAAASD